MRRACAIIATTKEGSLRWQALVGILINLTTPMVYARIAILLSTTRRERQSNRLRPSSRVNSKIQKVILILIMSLLRPLRSIKRARINRKMPNLSQRTRRKMKPLAISYPSRWLSHR
jgi:hypothetical protein